MIRKYFISGLLVLVPLIITLWVLNLIISTLDQSLLLLPEAWQPDKRIPLIGTVLTLLIVLLTGVLTRNFIGSYVLRMWEAVLNKIPVSVPCIRA